MRSVSSNDASEVRQLGDWIVLLWSCNASGLAVLPWMKDTMEAFQAVSFFSFTTAGIFQEHGGDFFFFFFAVNFIYKWLFIWAISTGATLPCGELGLRYCLDVLNALHKDCRSEAHATNMWAGGKHCVYVIHALVSTSLYIKEMRKKEKRFPCGNLNNKNLSIIHLCHYSYPPLHALPCGSTWFFRDGCVAGIPKCVNSTTYRIISSVPALLIEFIATWCMRYVCRLQFILVDVSFIWKQPCWQIWLCNQCAYMNRCSPAMDALGKEGVLFVCRQTAVGHCSVDSWKSL